MNFSFDSNKNKHDYYRGKDCTKSFCKDSREHEMKITNFEKLKMLPLTKKLTEIVIILENIDVLHILHGNKNM